MSNIFVTLGPTGTDHDNATRKYIAFQGIPDATIVFIDDFEVAVAMLRRGEGDFIVQNSCHPQVTETTERHYREVFVVDSFVSRTLEQGLVARADVDTPRTLGIMPATRFYIDVDKFEHVTIENSKPAVAANLLAGKYDAGIIHLHHVRAHPDKLRIVESFGGVDTAWLVYGRKRLPEDGVRGGLAPDLFGMDSSRPGSR